MKERNVRRESPKVDRKTEGRMPESEETPKFSSFPTQPPNQKANESQDAANQKRDPFDRNDPRSGYKPAGN